MKLSGEVQAQIQGMLNSEIDTRVFYCGNKNVGSRIYQNEYLARRKYRYAGVDLFFVASL